eukprot:718385-Hanusia_phi.AAC.2
MEVILMQRRRGILCLSPSRSGPLFRPHRPVPEAGQGCFVEAVGKVRGDVHVQGPDAKMLLGCENGGKGSFFVEDGERRKRCLSRLCNERGGGYVERTEKRYEGGGMRRDAMRKIMLTNIAIFMHCTPSRHL